MNINTLVSEKEIEIVLEGRLDTSTAPALEAELDKYTPDCPRLVLNMEQLSYLSSAGLRVLLLTQKAMAGREFVLRGVVPEVMTVLEMTGFTSLLSIE